MFERFPKGYRVEAAEFSPPSGQRSETAVLLSAEAEGTMDDERIAIVDLADELQVRKQRIF